MPADPKPAAPKPTHPADPRWQVAYVKFWPAIQDPSARDLIGRDCKLIWVDRDDWQRFMDWQRENVRGR